MFDASNMAIFVNWMLSDDEWKMKPSGIVVLMIYSRKSWEYFLPTVKIEGAVDTNFKGAPSI